MSKPKLGLVPVKPKLKLVPSALGSVLLAFGDVICGGEFSVESADQGAIRLTKLPHPEPIACLPPGSAYRHLDTKANRLFAVIAVNSQAVVPDKDGKHVYYRVPDDEEVLFFRRIPVRHPC